MREVVTVQLGAQANHIGTHFWNIQESYFTYSGQQESPVDHDVHFRPGIAVDGADTYTPRTVIYDFKPNWGSLRRLNELYEAAADEAADRAMWGGLTVPHRNPPVQPSEYQQALNAGATPARVTADKVRYWSDYSRTFFNPRSVVQVYESELNPGQTAFDDWQSGEDLFDALNREEDLFDRDVRPFIEECDQMQGLQLFTSSDNAWSAFASRYMYRLRDELGKSPIWVWAATGGTQNLPGPQRARSGVNESRGLYEITQLASKYIPMASVPRSRPFWIEAAEWRTDSAWFTSALQATAMESGTLCWRLKRVSSGNGESNVSMGQLSEDVDSEGKQGIAHVDFEVLDDAGQQQWAKGVTNGRNTTDEGRCDLFPDVAAAAARPSARQTFAEIMFTRGGKLEGDGDGEGGDERLGPKMHQYQSGLAFPQLDSFPRFSGSAAQGRMRTRIGSSSRIATWIKGLETAWRRHLPLEEREAVGDGLRSLADAYAPGGISDEDDSDY